MTLDDLTTPALVLDLGVLKRNLAMMRRAVVSIAVHWIKQRRPSRKATTNGFLDTMSAKQHQKAFSLVTARHSTALSTS